MCGINGIYADRLIDQYEKRIEAMNQSIKHRGPDAVGHVVCNNKLVLGHRRLSIIDLDERSNQPMSNNSGDIDLVYNGEIFNFQELKKELEADYNFITTSDSEVILAAYEVKGIKWLVESINGMYAMAIYDRRNNSLYLVRDRFGIKPLYYTIDEGVLIFSSEIKGILNSGLVEPSFNSRAIDDYLGYRYVREPNTFFKNIYQVPSASYLKSVDGKVVDEQIYWKLPRLNFDEDFDEKEIKSKTKIEVEEAIKRWLISDVKVGAYLSGGVDSSLTTAILTEHSNSQVDTYTIGFDEEGYNEFPFARIVAEKYDTNHHEILMSQEDYIGNWEDLIKYKDAPLAVPNEIPLAIMSSELSKDITVVISGEGADELFGGYGKIFRSAFDYENRKPDDNSFYDYFVGQYEYVSRDLRDRYLLVDGDYRQEFDEKVQMDFSQHRNEENIFRFFHAFHIKGLLNRVDLTTMQTSVEARPPFLDHKLIEYVYENVPYSLKLKWNDCNAQDKAKSQVAKQYSEELDTPKYILKKISEDWLSDDIIYRKKVGFPVPLTKWFPKLAEIADEALSEADWLNKSELENLINDLRNSNDIRAGQYLWMFINVEIFRKEYFRKSWKW